MNNRLRQAGSWTVLAAGFLCLTGRAAAQYPLSYTRPNGTPIPTFPPSINYPAFYIPTYNFLSSPALNYPLSYTRPNGTPIPTFPPSINYPAFYTPTYNFLSSPALNGQVAGNYNPAFFASNGGLNYSYAGNTIPLPAAQAMSYYPAAATADSSMAPTIFPLMGSKLDSHQMTPVWSRAGQSDLQVTTGAKADTRVRRSNRATAYIDLEVPAGAEVWFQGVKTKQTGSRRRFVSPTLAKDQAFEYDIRVRWTANGKPVTRTHQLTVRAGDWWQVDTNSMGVRSASIPLQTAAR